MRFSYIAYPLPEETEEDSGGDRRADDSGDVRSHRVHQKVVVRVELPADDLGYTRAVRNAGVSAVPMAARVSNTVGQKNNPSNFLLMHAMGPNVAGVIGSAVAAGILINIFG